MLGVAKASSIRLDASTIEDLLRELSPDGPPGNVEGSKWSFGYRFERHMFAFSAVCTSDGWAVSAKPTQAPPFLAHPVDVTRQSRGAMDARSA